MKHTGKQDFKDIDVSNNADVYKLSTIDKLNVPIRRSLTDPVHADLFMESGSLNIVDGNDDIKQLIDIHNSDIVKSLLTSELFFDEFMNFDKTDTGSFNESIDITTETFNQYDINLTYDSSTV
jgi:hypothetical protein